MASWKNSLCGGGFHDCLRAYFTPCCVFGQTRYRLERIDRHENPLDLEDYKKSNGACWDWFFFALPFDISCAVFTSREVRRVRQLYGIAGSRKKDVVTAIFCPCCSILRNELEVRTREEEKWNELHGPEDKKGYTPEKPMTSSLPEGVHSGKENRAPGTESDTTASGVSPHYGNGSRRPSAESALGHQPTQDDKSGKPPAGQADTPIRSGKSSPTLSATSGRHPETVTCTVVEDGQRHILHMNRAQLDPVMERRSEDTMSTAKKSRACASPPLQGENMPLGFIQESTSPGSPPAISPTVSSPLISRPDSLRKSIDRPPTPIPPEVLMSPILSVRSGTSGRSFQRIPLLHLSDGVPSPVQEAVEEGRVPAEPAFSPAANTNTGLESLISAKPVNEPTSEHIENTSEARSASPHGMVKGWLDDVGSPLRRESVDLLDHAFLHHPALSDRPANESRMTNDTLTPPLYTPLPTDEKDMTAEEDIADLTPRSTDAQESTGEEVRDEEPVQQANRPATDQTPTAEKSQDTSGKEDVKNQGDAKQTTQPATALSALGTTIKEAIESLMPIAAPSMPHLSLPHFPEHNVPIPHGPAAASSLEANKDIPQPQAQAKPTPEDAEEAITPRPADTHDMPSDSKPGEVTNQDIMPGSLPDQPLPVQGRRPSPSKIPHLKPVTPTIPPRPPVRISSSFPFTTPTVTVPATPAPPGTYPMTPAPEPPAPPTPAAPGMYPPTPGPATGPFGAGAGDGDAGPFVSFRAKQLLGHFLARDAPRTGTTEKGMERGGRGRGGRMGRTGSGSGSAGGRGDGGGGSESGYTPRHDERVWGPPQRKHSSERVNGRGRGMERRGSRKGMGTE